MDVQLGVQMYSLGAAVAEETSAVVARLASIGYRGVEPVLQTEAPSAMQEWARSMGIEDPPPVDLRELRNELDAWSLVVPACHGHLTTGAATDRMLDELEVLGCPRLVVRAVFDDEANSIQTLATTEAAKRVADRFNAMAARARERGARVGYHSHFWEFGATSDGVTGLEAFFAECDPDVFAEVDLYWARVAGQDPAALLQTLGERVELLHVKDGDGVLGSPSCPLGEGVLDLEAAFAAASPSRWDIVEPEGLDGIGTWSIIESSFRDLSSGRFTQRST